jgi:hypothetical protein
MIIKTSKTCRILAINKYENEGQFAAKLWLERHYNNNTGDNNRNANRGGKYADRLEMFVRNMHDYDVLT